MITLTDKKGHSKRTSSPERGGDRGKAYATVIYCMLSIKRPTYGDAGKRGSEIGEILQTFLMDDP